MLGDEASAQRWASFAGLASLVSQDSCTIPPVLLREKDQRLCMVEVVSIDGWLVVVRLPGARDSFSVGAGHEDLSGTESSLSLGTVQAERR